MFGKTCWEAVLTKCKCHCANSVSAANILVFADHGIVLAQCVGMVTFDNQHKTQYSEANGNVMQDLARKNKLKCQTDGRTK